MKPSFKANYDHFIVETERDGADSLLANRVDLFKGLNIMLFFFWLMAIAFPFFYLDQVYSAFFAWFLGIALLATNMFIIKSFVLSVIWLFLISLATPLLIFSGFFFLCLLGFCTVFNVLIFVIVLVGMIFYAYWDYRLIDKEKLYRRFKRICITKVSDGEFLVQAANFSKEREQLNVPHKKLKKKASLIVLSILPVFGGLKVVSITPGYIDTVGLTYYFLPVAYLEIMMAPFGVGAILPLILNLQFYFRAKRELT